MKQEIYEIHGKEFRIVDEELEIDLNSSCEFVERDYYLTKELKHESCRKGELLHGVSTFYSRGGEILSQTWFYEGMKIGKVYRYYSDGSLSSIERYVSGFAHLQHEYYYIDGTLKSVIRYEKGRLHGKTQLFWPDGALKRECQFSEGKKEMDQFYDPQGNSIGYFQTALS